MSLEIDDSGFLLACFDHAISGTLRVACWDMGPLRWALVSPNFFTPGPFHDLVPTFKCCVYKTTSRQRLHPHLVFALCICVATCLTCLMRLFHVLPILSFLFGASASSLESRQPDAHPLDARDVSDVCALLNPDSSNPSYSQLVQELGYTGQYGPFNAPTLNCFKASSVS
jgi:hypothetical protein